MYVGEVIGIPGAIGVDGTAIIDRLINLDANANTAVTSCVIEAVVAALSGPTNPSSAHVGGEVARTILAKARDAVALLASGVDENSVVFTSGCTEANNMVLNAVRSQHGTLITTAVEHPSILAPADALQVEGFPVHILPVDCNGIVDLSKVEAALDATRGPIVLSVQTANSETGVIQPIEAIAELVAHRPNVIFHTDAAQAFGKLPVGVGSAGPHVATLSGHKLHAPMGVGALLLSRDERRIGALLLGGEQQRGRRSGTEPLALIAGLGAACAERSQRIDEDVAAMASLRNRLESGIMAAIPGTAVNGAKSPRLPNTSSIRFPGLDAMALVARLDADGVLVSQGSACSSMRPTPSHVLLAMGQTEEEAFSTVRFSTSPLNTVEEIDEAIKVVTNACLQMRTML